MNLSVSYSLLLTTLLISFTGVAQKVYPTIGSIQKSHALLDELLDPSSPIEVLATGFQWSEGPIWIKEEKALLFSDVPKNTIYKWSEKEGLSTYLQPSGYTGRGHYSNEPGSNGLTIDHLNRLILAEHGDRRIAAMPLQNGGKITLSAHYNGKRFNSPNDIVQHPISKEYYFTDPPYGLKQHEKDPTRELDFFGVYKINTKGETILLDQSLTRPNGIALSPDGLTLYVAQSDPNQAILKEYNLNQRGEIQKSRILYDATPLVRKGLQGLPDGLKVDQKGNIWMTGPGGVLVLNKEGILLGTIQTTTATANCTWGDDGYTLYITANSMICRVKTKVKGIGF
jgi:gluconolactonase